MYELNNPFWKIITTTKSLFSFPISYGQIFDVDNVPDSNNGNLKIRPVVILTPDHLMKTHPLVAAAITSKYPNPATNDYVELPWSYQRSRTNLVKKSAVHKDWVVKIDRKDLLSHRGVVPPYAMKKVNLLTRAKAKQLGGFP